MNDSIEKVAVVGLGYVGLPLALLADEKGLAVIGLDIAEDKIELLKKKESPIEDAAIEKSLQDCSADFSTDLSKVKECDVIVICVPTPVHEDNTPNLGPVESACKSIAPYVQKGQLVVLESTVNPGVSESVVLPILEKESKLTGGDDFYLAHCPERINPGDEKWTIRNIPRVVGSLSDKGVQKALEFYGLILDTSVKPMGSLKEAEAVKVVENSFRDINIAFVNELAKSFKDLGIDVVNVIDGAATKPFSFMPHYPGCGVGGHCIPVDPYYLIEYARKTSGFKHDFLSLARKINSSMPAFTARRVMDGLNEKRMAINGSKVAVLGLAYKPNIDDTRESPAFQVADSLEGMGAEVVRYDPFVPEQSDVKTLEEALDKADAIVLTTAHDEFTALTPEMCKEHNVGVLVDGRNCLDKHAFREAGIVYKGVGV